MRRRSNSRLATEKASASAAAPKASGNTMISRVTTA
jgi:hypothetical protein